MAIAGKDQRDAAIKAQRDAQNQRDDKDQRDAAVGVSPPLRIDRLWHRHILHTRRYETDCRRLCGAYVHHDLGNALHRERRMERQKRTRELYRQMYGRDPPALVWGRDGDDDESSGSSSSDGWSDSDLDSLSDSDSDLSDSDSDTLSDGDRAIAGDAGEQSSIPVWINPRSQDARLHTCSPLATVGEVLEDYARGLGASPRDLRVASGGGIPLALSKRISDFFTGAPVTLRVCGRLRGC